MKTKSFLLKVVGVLTLLILFGVFLVNCSKTNDNALITKGSDPLKTVNVVDQGDSCVNIIAGQSIDAGDICFDDVDTDGDNQVDALQVTFSTDQGWELKVIHFYIGNSFASIPATRKGNFIPGQFPFKFGTTQYSFEIPFDYFNFYCDGLVPPNIFIAAHCELGIPNGNGGYSQTESGWGSGYQSNGNNWAMWFMISISCDIYQPPTPTCEEAWAFEENISQCFSELDLDEDGNPDFNRVGWTIGPLVPSTTPFEFQMWSAAGECEPEGYGTQVGTISVLYDGTFADVTYNMFSGFTMTETHLYIGNMLLPIITDPLDPEYGMPTVSAGLLKYNHLHLSNVSSDSYVNLEVTGTVYLLAQAIVCGNY